MTKRKKVLPESSSIVDDDKPISGYLTTGSTLLDLAISCNKHKFGGVPVNRMTEFSGTGASGKTYFCMELCGSAIRQDFDRVVVDDIERRWDLERLDTFGFSADHHAFTYYKKPSSTVEECFERLMSVANTGIKNGGEKILYIIDPVAALYSAGESQDKKDKMGQLRAKELHRQMRYIKDIINGTENDIAIVFSNQMIDNVGANMPGAPKRKSAGGNAMVHWPSIRAEFARTSNIVRSKKIKGSDKKAVMGVNLRAKIIKNSEDDPFRQVDISVRFGYGIDDILDCVNWLKAHTEVLDPESVKGGKIKKTWFHIPDIIEPVGTLKNFISQIERGGAEGALTKLTAKQFRKYYKLDKRKKRVRVW